MLHSAHIHPHIAIHWSIQQAGELLFKGTHAAKCIEGIGFNYAEFGRFHEGVARYLGELGDTVFELHREHHIGVFAHLVCSNHKNAPVAAPEWVDQAAELAGSVQHGCPNP